MGSDNGCSGGWPHTAYDSYYTGAGACSEDSYSYTAQDGSCRASSCNVALARGTVTGQINHAVIAVGYGVDGQSYFRIRNSWGSSWGESGNIRLAQSGGSQDVACLYQYAPVTPTLSTAPIPTPPQTPPTPVPPQPTPAPPPSGSCHAISSVTTDDWCNANCHAGFCPD